MTTSPSVPVRRAAATLAGLALAATGLTVAGSPAGATDVSQRPAAANVTVTIALQSGAREKLGGKVKSRRLACKQGRTVTLHWQEPGKSRFVIVQDDRTSRTGVWAVPAPGSDIPPGRYFARVAKKATTCQADKSPTIRVR